MSPRNKLYFASDFHLGAGGYMSSREREDRLVRWLDMIKADAAEIFLMGDVFDFWFEYSAVVPKGYIRFLGKLAELSDSGIKIYMFKGNHDMWMLDYFTKEFGAVIISDELIIERNGRKFYLHHGDGLGPGDRKYKALKKIFRSKLCQWLFARIHPNFAVGLADRWSSHSRLINKDKNEKVPQHQEWLITHSRDLLLGQFYDYFIYGHRHKPFDISLDDKSRYINLGEWVTSSTYAEFDGQQLYLKIFENPVVPASLP